MDLRILGGIYKNRKIKMHNKSTARPTLVRARTILFDTLMFHMVDNFSFLDVFAGSGANGIEALSRGSNKVVFFDMCEFAIKGIKENLKSMEKISGQYSVLKTNALRPPEGSIMDVVFLDPPYEKYYIIPDVLKKLEKYGWIGKGTVVVVERFMKNDVKLSEKYEMFKKSYVSNSVLEFYENTGVIDA